MGSFLCKIWTFVLKVADAVVSGIADVVRGILTELVDIIAELWDMTLGKGTVGGVVTAVGLGLLLFFVVIPLLSEKETS